MKLIKNLVLAVVIAVLSLSCASPVSDSFTEKNLDVTSFNAVEISSGFITEFKQSDTYSVKLEIPDKAAESLIAEVRTGKLILGFDTKIWDVTTRKHITYNRPKAFITAPSIEDISLHGAAELDFTDGFRTDDIEIEVSGASQIKGELKAVKMELELSGASSCKITVETDKADIKVSGASSLKSKISANMLKLETEGASSSEVEPLNRNTGAIFEAEVSGASKLDAANIPFKIVEIEASGASKAEVCATEKLDAEASGASKIRFNKTDGLITQINARGASSIKAQ